MNHDPPSLEAELRELQAAAFDDAFLSRLEAAADGTLTQLNPEEIRFEAFLRGIRPVSLTPELLARLETTTRGVPFPLDDKIVLLPAAAATVHTRRKRPMWGAAAAVALIGAGTALLMPTGKAPTTIAQQGGRVSPSPVRPSSGNFVPATFNRSLSEVRDEGVVWKTKTQPHSVVRVVYKDKITHKDKDGRTYQIEQPKVEYMLVPAKTN